MTHKEHYLATLAGQADALVEETVARWVAEKGTKKYVFDITEPQDGTFWFALLSSGATVSGRTGPNGWFEVTAVVPDGARVHAPDWPTVPFETWLEDVMGERASVFVVTDPPASQDPDVVDRFAAALLKLARSASPSSVAGSLSSIF